MKKLFTLCFFASFNVFFYSCLKPDVIEPEVVSFNKSLDILQVIPYQTISFGGNKYPGIIDDYKMFFGSLEIPISKLTPDSIYAFVPFEVQEGRTDVKLVYKENAFDLGSVDIIDWNTILPSNVSYIETENDEFPLHITDSLSNAIIPHVQNGVIDKIHINGHDGTNSIIELNSMGLPSFIYSKNESIMLDGYNLEEGTVNVAKFPSDNLSDPVYKYGVKINVDDLNVLINARNGRRAGEDVDQMLTIVGTVFSITGCVVSWIPPFTPFGALGAFVGCSSAIYDAIKILNPDQDNKLASAITSVHSIKMNLINCLKFVTKPKNAKELHEALYGCYGIAIEAAKGMNTLYSEYRARLEKDLKMQEAILNSGYGDIKITLAWNTSADIDLWVIDPNGEKIYYGNRTTSSKGELDLDDTDGLGPENVFWPTNEAPIMGTYKVQVHYYGPEDGAATSYRVVINNFGKSKTFTGTISYNQVVSIADFSAGLDWNNSGNRIAADISTVDRTTLPIK
jgi:hypothetical protein